jgi:tRNA(Ile)-lysidine synthase
VIANSHCILEAVRASFTKNIKDKDKDKDKEIEVNLALSGGCDSVVLLYILKSLQKELNLNVNATYIDHGLSDNSNEWLIFCEKICKKNNIYFEHKSINIKKLEGLGIEGAARELRYKALFSMHKGVLVTAHHENDQAETLILQLIRGAGLKGLSGMPEYDLKKNIWRPLLNIRRKEIKTFAEMNHIEYIEDESNGDTSFDRNFLRKEILPKLYERFPHASKTISRSASLIAKGFYLNYSIAKEDSLDYFSENLTRLNLRMTQELTQERVINLIRWWLEKNEQKMPSLKVMLELYKQIKNIKKDSLVNIKISQDMSIRAYNNELWLVPIKNTQQNYEIFWRGEEEIMLPDMSKLLFKRITGSGISLKKLSTSTIRIQNRKGGERFKPAHNEPSRTLKYLLQKSKMPPWERDDVPLLFIEDHLIAVPSFGIDHAFHSKKNEDAYQVTWLK